MNKSILAIIIVLILIIGGVIVLYFTTDIFDGIFISDSGDNNSQTDIDGFSTYQSSAGFSFQYPSDFIKFDYDDLWGFHTPENNTESVNFIMPQDCYDKFTALFDKNSNLEIDPNINELEYLGDRCAMLEVSKESISFQEELNSWTNSDSNMPSGGTDYQFAGITGSLNNSQEEVEGITNYDINLTGTSGDYIFTINITGHGYNQDELLGMVKDIANSMDVQESALTELDSDADQDGDGLTNGDELLYGTDATMADSDSDGYNDWDEVWSCYNPLGQGKMTGTQFVNFCINWIASSSLISNDEYKNREKLCNSWQPIAEDYLDGNITDTLFYKGLYDNYPEACKEIDEIMGEAYCSNLKMYLNYMCPGI